MNMKKLIMRSGLILIVAGLVTACISPQQEQVSFRALLANQLTLCNIENILWEDTGQPLERPAWWIHRDQPYLLNWHLFQCKGRDPEPLKCRYNVPYGFDDLSIECLNGGQEEDYRVLTGLISAE